MNEVDIAYDNGIDSFMNGIHDNNKGRKRIMGFYTGPDNTSNGINRFIQFTNQEV